MSPPPVPTRSSELGGSHDGLLETSHPVDATHAEPPQTSPRNRGTVSQVTPQRVSFHDSEGTYRKIQHIQEAVHQELADAWVAADDGKTRLFQESLKRKIDGAYPDLKTKAQGWVHDYAGYDEKTRSWTNIPCEPRLGKHLYTPISNLLRDIVKEFGNDVQPEQDREPGQVLKKREVKLTWNRPFPHNIDDAEDDETILKSCPDICIMGVGPAATREADLLEAPSYSQVATPVRIKRKDRLTKIVKDQVSIYAREVFIKQPNRLFVYAPVMTGKTIRVIQFDRSGAQYSEPIDYHADPIFFIKLVVLFSSLNEELVGYDTSIYWENSKRMLAMVPDEIWDTSDQSAGPHWKPNDENRVLVFEILNKDGEPNADPEPLFARHTIRSRGTVCWRVMREGREFLIKDYWGVDKRTRESEFLKEVAGTKGVGQMYAFADDRESTCHLRGFEPGSRMMSTTETFVPNRSLSRLALEMYMDTLNTATSAHQLLSAVRDIVSGHRDALLSKGILHRDISLDNLLLSPKENESGVLIDFDMAKKTQDILSNIGTVGDSRTGTRAYQSIKVLFKDEKLGHHDHMDDLESIFYVLFHVCYGHDLNGAPLPVPPPDISHWHSMAIDPVALGEIKAVFLIRSARTPMTRFSGAEKGIMLPLMSQLRKFFRNRLDAIDAAITVDDPIAFPSYSPTDALADYSRFLGLIDAAIEKLLLVIPVPPPPSPLHSEGFTGSKRGRAPDLAEHDDPSAPPRKKAALPSPASMSAPAAEAVLAPPKPSLPSGFEGELEGSQVRI
ncbi:hypothetical protein B0H11DRAFT_2270088 [Mycena galericulata]|nr:hypothetical protein B0H11DRAFT_2270088 [Mycena galericulata]